MVRKLVAALAILMLAACLPNDDPAPGNGDPTESPNGDPVAVCLEGETFAGEGTIEVPAPDTPGDAHQVSGLRADAHDGCDRFVIDLATEEGSPATVAGDVRAEFLRDLGVVRINLRDVEMVDLDHTEATFDGPLARQAYAVWSPEGRWVYVDVHVGEPAQAHVFVLQDPARVVVDLRPGGAEMIAPEGSENNVVVLEPRPGPATYPLTVRGYARTFEANVVIRLEQDGEDVLEDFTTATAWVDAWGDYAFNIESGPTGAVTLHVGEYSARDGEWSGKQIELDLE